MKVKILDSNTRCPYCGELAILHAKLHNFGAHRQRCEKCGREYVFQYNIGIEMLWFWSCFGAFYAVRSLVELYGISPDTALLIFVLLPLLCIIWYPPFWMHYPLRPIEETRWGNCSSYDVMLKINSNEKKYFRENMIYPICFIDSDGISASKYCCVKVTEIKNKKGAVYCIMTELPCGEKIDRDWTKYGFDIFFDKRVIGTGRVLQ